MGKLATHITYRSVNIDFREEMVSQQNNHSLVVHSCDGLTITQTIPSNPTKCDKQSLRDPIQNRIDPLKIPVLPSETTALQIQE